METLLACVAEQALVDHHCHGLLYRDADEATLESMLNEGAAWPGGSMFDSQAGFAFRRLCPPVLGLPPHAELPDYVLRRAELGATEVNKRFLVAAGISALCVDTGFTPEPITSPAELGGLAGATAHEIVRLERVAEDVVAAGIGAAGFADAVRSALATRTASAVGVKSIAAYRTGLDLNPERPSDAEVTAAAGRWLAAQTGRSGSPTRRCSGSSSGAAWTWDCRSSSTWATGTATSTWTAATRCCSPRCCGRSSRPGPRSCCCTTTPTTARPATWPRSSRTCTSTRAWPPTTWAVAPPPCSPRRWSSRRSASSCTPRTRSGCRNCTTWGRRLSITRPEIDFPGGEPPTELQITDIWEGDGSPAGPGDLVEVHYVGVAYSTGEEFDASWNRNDPLQFRLGAGQVIAGWDQGVAGMKVGGRRQLIIPPDLAYGDRGAGHQIAPGETLIFVCDLVSV